MDPVKRARRIEELRGNLRRGCAGPRKFARRKLREWVQELRWLEREARS